MKKVAIKQTIYMHQHRGKEQGNFYTARIVNGYGIVLVIKDVFLNMQQMLSIF